MIVTGNSMSKCKLCLRLRDDQVFERGPAALDQPLQRAGGAPWPPLPGGGPQRQRDRDGVFVWQRETIMILAP